MGSIRHEFSRALAPSLSPLSPAADFHQRLPDEGSKGRSGKGQEMCAPCPYGFRLQALGDLGAAVTPSIREFLEKKQAGPEHGHLCPGTLWSKTFIV